jgi:NADH-quinone oxidoreductase subunit J
VLFLFVVMMLDVDFAELRRGAVQYLPFSAAIGIVFAFELGAVVWGWSLGPSATQAITSPSPAGVTNTEALGRVLYTQYVYFFQASGMVLLVAMVGAIVLTLRHKAKVRRQSIAAQVARTKATAIDIRQVRPGQGI